MFREFDSHLLIDAALFLEVARLPQRLTGIFVGNFSRIPLTSIFRVAEKYFSYQQQHYLEGCNLTVLQQINLNNTKAIFLNCCNCFSNFAETALERTYSVRFDFD